MQFIHRRALRPHFVISILFRDLFIFSISRRALNVELVNLQESLCTFSQFSCLQSCTKSNLLNWIHNLCTNGRNHKRRERIFIAASIFYEMSFCRHFLLELFVLMIVFKLYWRLTSPTQRKKFRMHLLRVNQSKSILLVQLFPIRWTIHNRLNFERCKLFSFIKSRNFLLRVREHGATDCWFCHTLVTHRNAKRVIKSCELQIKLSNDAFAWIISVISGF